MTRPAMGLLPRVFAVTVKKVAAELLPFAWKKRPISGRLPNWEWMVREHDSHRRGQRGLLDERAVDDLATSGVIDGFEGVFAGCGRGLCRGEGAVAREEKEQRKCKGEARDERDQGGSPVRSHPLAGSAVPSDGDVREDSMRRSLSLYKLLTWTAGFQHEEQLRVGSKKDGCQRTGSSRASGWNRAFGTPVCESISGRIPRELRKKRRKHKRHAQICR